MDVHSPLRCAPARRSLKFPVGEQSRNFLAFDPSISKHDRMIFHMGVLAHAESLIDSDILPCFTVPVYLPGNYTELRVITDRRHPAFGQIGLFAKRTIPANFVVTPYSGYVEIFGTSCSSRTYTMGYGSLSDDYALDAEFAGNYGRFANDPRGMEGVTANISAESRFTARGETYTALVSRRIINKGEEILMSYGKAHNLTHSPWTGIKGELLTRYRVRSPMPFQFRGVTRLEGKHNDSSISVDNRGGNSRIVGVLSANSLQPCCSNQNRVTSGGVTERSRSGSGQPSTSTSDTDVELFWECPQCGMWSIRNFPTPQVDFCPYCRSPRVYRTRLVAVCCRAPLPQEVLTGPTLPTEPVTSQRETISSTDAQNIADGTVGSSPEANSHCSHLSVQSKDIHNEDNIRGSQSKSSSGSGSTQASSTTLFTSHPINWPLNVPFLPWQVWDAAVPLTTIGRHSKFDTHNDIFLYTVNTLAEQEADQPLSDEMHQSDNNCGGSSLQNERNEDDEDGAEEEPHETRGKKRPRRGRQPRVRRKKEELWVKEDQNISDPHVPGKYDIAKRCGTVGSSPAAERGFCTDYFFLLSDSLICSGSGDDDANALRAVRSLLSDVTRRVFAGKTYRSGDVVASVGGLIQLVHDTRRRPDGSVMRIPMKYFIPKRVRDELSSNHEGVGAEAAVERMALVDLLRLFESLALVVTNELMFCPCIALPDRGDCGSTSTSVITFSGSEVGANARDPSLTSQRVLELCNLQFVLTVDALGCPYIAAVATKDINTFDPFLARIG
ncbi:SET domain containing protein [Trypanosoma brucei equiperdum]|uniref:SET domain containing protein n=1 Tax=Trypanosoma brucei equiperdum TaxID=630700 RepID=A0A3L6L7N7_9TRYP|nr:SET domain containing protein [Trypanosoma brucei equiperdum]